MPVELNRRLLTVKEYHQMGEAGILQENGLELIKGEILEMSPIGSKHAATVEIIRDLLHTNLTEKVLIRTQNPITLDTYSEPAPDIAIVSFRDDYYLNQHPKAQDTLLLIEVASSSLEFDREIKVPLYALAGIPELWIIDLEAKQVEVFHTPAGSRYKHSALFAPSDSITTQKISLVIPVDRIFI